MSIGINDWQNEVASLQNGVSSRSNIPGINAIELPSWLSRNPDDSMRELTSAYAGIGTAFDPTGQVEARNNAIAYNTTAGSQAANNAATEYSNRAAQSGASGLGAGAVKAQAMMPVLSQNAALKIDAADTAAKSHQQGAALASQIAGTIGNLRTNYLQMLTGYAQGQQGLQLDKYRAEQQVALGQSGQAMDYIRAQQAMQLDRWKAEQAQALSQQQLSLSGRGLDLDKWKAEQANQLALQQQALSRQQLDTQTRQSEASLRQQESDQARLAAMALLGAPRPTGTYVTGNQGNILEGQSYYDSLKGWGTARDRAQQTLMGMI